MPYFLLIRWSMLFLPLNTLLLSSFFCSVLFVKIRLFMLPSKHKFSLFSFYSSLQLTSLPTFIVVLQPLFTEFRWTTMATLDSVILSYSIHLVFQYPSRVILINLFTILFSVVLHVKNICYFALPFDNVFQFAFDLPYIDSMSGIFHCPNRLFCFLCVLVLVLHPFYCLLYLGVIIKH